MAAVCDLRWVQDAVAAVAYWRWRALSEVPSHQRTEQVAEPSSDRVLRFHPSAEQRRPSTSDTYLVCAAREHKD